MKKAILALALSVLLVAMFAMPAFAAPSYDAYLIGDINGWGSGFWGPGDDGNVSDGNGVKVTGDGDYTVWIDWASEITAVEFIALIVNAPAEGAEPKGESKFVDYPDGLLTIKSVKVDGTDVALTGGWMKQEDGVMRHFINSPWNDTHAVNSAAPFIGGNRVEVVFTISGFSGDGGNGGGNGGGGSNSAGKTNDSTMIGLALLALGLAAAGAFFLRRKLAA
jgi:LPXTG-motif cell wall-anchored protein